MLFLYKVAPVVQKVDSTNTYPLDSDLSGG